MSTTRAPLHAVHICNGNEERVILTAALAAELPALDLPQPTEPMHFGATAKVPAPARGPSKHTNTICDAIIYLTCAATLAWVVLQAVTR